MSVLFYFFLVCFTFFVHLIDRKNLRKERNDKESIKENHTLFSSSEGTFIIECSSCNKAS